ncbi:MAG: ClbS/DfsB family four-helix bundle protein [Anaerolineales bacterium]|nr:ClbS/DfsB family four-helix bundle protein [Anaerolineales bacterium]
MSIQEKIIQQYEQSHSAIMTQLEEIDRNRKIYPLWTIREIVAHLSGWDDAAIAFLGAVLKGKLPATPAMRGFDIYNAETVSTREGLSYDHIVREYISTRAKILALARTASDEILTTKSVLPWGGEGTFEQIAEGLCEHETTHAGDIKKFIEEHNSK